MYDLTGSLGTLPLAKHRKSRAINAENPTGEKGKGGMATSELGVTRGRVHRHK
ncbi:MAG: hypothetical protein ACI4EH_10045 [Oliverpabstia sp.]